MSFTKKIIFIAVALMLISAVALMSACSGEAKTEATTAAASESAETTAEAVETTENAEPAQTTAAAEEEPAPTGNCPDASTVSIESKNGAWVDAGEISWEKVGTQQALISNSTNNTAVYISIANFETSEDLKSLKLTDGQSVAYFVMTVKGEGEQVPVELGKYSLKDYDSSTLFVEASIKVKNGSAVQISQSDLINGDFEITSVTDNEICGKFDISDKWSAMTGEFKVPFVK